MYGLCPEWVNGSDHTRSDNPLRSSSTGPRSAPSDGRYRIQRRFLLGPGIWSGTSGRCGMHQSLHSNRRLLPPRELDQYFSSNENRIDQAFNLSWCCKHGNWHAAGLPPCVCVNGSTATSLVITAYPHWRGDWLLILPWPHCPRPLWRSYHWDAKHKSSDHKYKTSAIRQRRPATNWLINCGRSQFFRRLYYCYIQPPQLHISPRPYLFIIMTRPHWGFYLWFHDYIFSHRIFIFSLCLTRRAIWDTTRSAVSCNLFHAVSKHGA